MMGAVWSQRKPLRVHLLAIFLLGLFMTSGLLIFINTMMGRDAALLVAQQHMETAATGIIERTYRLFREIQTFVRTASSARTLTVLPGQTSHPAAPMLFEAVRNLPEVDGIFIGFSNGSFFHLVDLDAAEAWRARLEAPEQAAVAIRSIMVQRSGERISQWSFFDANEVLIGQTEATEATYDPRVRPWYKGALRTDQVSWVDPYIFATTGEMGITASRMVISGGAVIGADVTLRELAQFLDQQKVSPSSEAAIFTQEGHLMVHPRIAEFAASTIQTAQGPQDVITMESSGDRVMQALYQQAKALNWPIGSGFQFEVDGKAYLASLQRLPAELGEGTFLGIAAPTAELTRHVDGITRITLIASLLLLVSAIPVVVWVSRSMSRSLGRLALEAKNLSSLSDVKEDRVYSRVTEIHVLSDALHTSRTALETFGRYVPKSLVRKVVDSCEEPTLGGDRRHVTLLFTDIVGFTTISEATRPEVLVELLSEYFSGVSRIVHAYGGTINKYIGDAVMAMWNVPEVQQDHILAACKAALEIQDFVRDFNRQMVARGMPVFETRLGIHSGVALVGHVGDSDHIEYTALGDTVNIAARLEGLNKDYGTTILISEVVAEVVKDQCTVRFVDTVAPKGRKNTIDVYELTAKQPVERAADAATARVPV
jgi:adenylate cyclase